MSRIGRKPVPILDGVKVALSADSVAVEGPLGKMEFPVAPQITVEIDEESKQVKVERKDDDRQSRALHGLTRSVINNMIIGTKDGYVKKLEIVGVGYIGSIQNGVLQLRVGFANELKKKIPEGLDVSCPDQTHIVVKGCDKQKVGQFAAEVRALRKPEPYKGKGIRYDGEHVKIKPGKSAS